ncbi:unnamed protein product [Pleuronectes platessa]|uniref:Teneurin N-terminal domain-containing protein n=1 Tax=Pleuronectes platessa TaxID=8262 RepID=A0A9N7UX36_PLEPL|nr:unnamed protein product [Pleuronectes platessa]
MAPPQASISPPQSSFDVFQLLPRSPNIAPPIYVTSTIQHNTEQFGELQECRPKARLSSACLSTIWQPGPPCHPIHQDYIPPLAINPCPFSCLPFDFNSLSRGDCGDLPELPSSPGGQFTFRPLPPPPPPPHACTCARPAPYTQVSLQRKTMPTRCQASQGGQGADNGSSTDQAQLHNSWVLNSNIPLETRHFLFKQGSGSSALLSGAGQGYPLTSGTVYSPPPRPLPRSSVTRPLFTFNKPHRCCNWKCTAVSASLLTLTLALLLTYVIDLCFGRLMQL